MVKGVIFDMDGVLVDNRELHVEAFRQISAKYGVDFSEDMLYSLFGRGNDEIFPALFPADKIKEYGLEPLADEKEALYRELARDIKPTPGLVQFLTQLRAKGIRCAVGSSGSEANVNFVLRSCGIESMFDAVANGDMVTHAKPDPEVFLLAARKLSLEPQVCIVIEDSFAGIKAAGSAGMKAIAMATTHSREELARAEVIGIVDDFTQLDYDTLVKLDAR